MCFPVGEIPIPYRGDFTVDLHGSQGQTQTVCEGFDTEIWCGVSLLMNQSLLSIFIIDTVGVLCGPDTEKEIFPD